MKAGVTLRGHGIVANTWGNPRGALGTVPGTPRGSMNFGFLPTPPLGEGGKGVWPVPKTSAAP